MLKTQYNTPEEEVLIRRASRGDSEAFGEIVRLFQRLVYNTVRSMVRNEEDVLDVSQEIFIKIWRSIGKYRGDCRFSTWVYRITKNACLDFLRHAKYTAAEPLPTFTDKYGDEACFELRDDSEEASPEHSAVRKETVMAVRTAIERLSPEQREVITLRDIEGYSYEAISDMLGLELGTVKSRINRARLHLKELLSDSV